MLYFDSPAFQYGILKAVCDNDEKFCCEIHVIGNVHSGQIRGVAMCDAMTPADHFLVEPIPDSLKCRNIKGEYVKILGKSLEIEIRSGLNRRFVERCEATFEALPEIVNEITLCIA